jgi:hypothetical protein
MNFMKKLSSLFSKIHGPLKKHGILILLAVITMCVIFLYMMQLRSGFSLQKCQACEGFDSSTSIPTTTSMPTSSVPISSSIPTPNLAGSVSTTPSTMSFQAISGSPDQSLPEGTAHRVHKQGSTYASTSSPPQQQQAQAIVQQPVVPIVQTQPQYYTPSTFINPKGLVVDESALYKKLVTHAKFGPPLGDSVSANTKLTNITDAFHTELNRIVNNVSQANLNTPIGTLLGPQVMNQSVASLFPKTSAIMSQPIKNVLNPDITINQIADQLQPPGVAASTPAPST